MRLGRLVEENLNQISMTLSKAQCRKVRNNDANQTSNKQRNTQLRKAKLNAAQ